MGINVIVNENIISPNNMVQLGANVFNNPSIPNIIDIQNYINAYGPFSPGTIFWYGPDTNNPNYVWTIDGINTVILLHENKFPDNSTVLNIVANDLDINNLPTEPFNVDNLYNGLIIVEKYNNALLFWDYFNAWSLKFYYITDNYNISPVAYLDVSNDSSGIKTFSVTPTYYEGALFTNADSGIVRVYNADTGAIIYNSGIVPDGNLFNSTYVTGTMGDSISVKYDLYLTDNVLADVEFLVQYYAITQYKQSFLTFTTFKA